MKRNNLLALSVILVLFTNACDNNISNKIADIGNNVIHEDHHATLIKVSMPAKTGIINYFCELSGMLKPDSNLVIGEYGKTMFLNNKYYVLDGKTNTLFCLDSTGNLIWKYAKAGGGPQEIKKLGDFAVREGVVYILDPYGRKVIQLDKNGKFSRYTNLRMLKDGIYPSHLFVDKKTQYFFLTHDMGNDFEFPYEFAVFDTSLNSLLSAHLAKTREPRIKRWSSESFPLRPFNDNSGFYYTRPLDDTIYTFNNGIFHSKYAIDFGEKKVPAPLRKKPDLTLNEFFASGYAGNLQSVFDTDSILSFSYYFNRQLKTAFYDKRTGNIQEYSMLLLNLGLSLHQIRIIGSTRKEFFVSIEPMVLLAAFSQYKREHPGKDNDQLLLEIKQKHPLFYSLLDNTTVNSNPILLSLKPISDKLYNK